MSGQVMLSCPFCHLKAEYYDTPPNSTVRCHECRSIFRVPANVLHKHKPGTVLAGEHIRTSKLKYLLLAAAAAVVVAGGFFLVKALKAPPVQDVDALFKHVTNLYPANTAHGTLQRFLESWKLGDVKLMMEYARPSDRKGNEEYVDSIFGNVRLDGYEMKGYKEDQANVFEYRVDLEGEDTRTKGGLKGSMGPRVVLEPINTPEGRRSVWGVDVRSAAPRWD